MLDTFLQNFLDQFEERVQVYDVAYFQKMEKSWVSVLGDGVWEDPNTRLGVVTDWMMDREDDSDLLEILMLPTLLYATTRDIKDGTPNLFSLVFHLQRRIQFMFRCDLSKLYSQPEHTRMFSVSFHSYVTAHLNRLYTFDKIIGKMFSTLQPPEQFFKMKQKTGKQWKSLYETNKSTLIRIEEKLKQYEKFTTIVDKELDLLSNHPLFSIFLTPQEIQTFQEALQVCRETYHTFQAREKQYHE